MSLEGVLTDVPLLEGLGSERLARLAEGAQESRFSAGETLFRRGDAADAFYVLRHGTVALETFVPTRGAVTIETIESGEVLGWSWLFPPYRWHFDARALTDLDAVTFDGAGVRRTCDDDPAFGYFLMGRFAQVLMERLQWTRLRLLDVYGDRGPH